MKKILLLFISVLITSIGFSQTTKEAEKQLQSRATKDARKEAKSLTKEGWKVSPGALPLEKQLDRSYLMQYQLDDNGQPKFIMGEASSIGENYDGAKMQALSLATQNLAGQIETKVVALVSNNVSNQQLSAEEAASITRTVSESKNLISQKLGRLVPVVETYRDLKNKNKEVLVRLSYNMDNALQVTKQTVREELEKKGDDLRNQLDKVLGF